MGSNNEHYNNLSDFFDGEYHSLKGYVQSRISNSTERDAEDIVQDVALRVFSRSHDAIPVTNIGGFVYSAIKNRIIDIMRTKKETKYDSEDIDTQWAEFAELFYGNADNTYSEEMKDQLQTAIGNLNPSYRDIIIAVDFEGYSYKEISEQTGIPQGTLMSRRHRAISMLFKDLKFKIV